MHGGGLRAAHLDVYGRSLNGLRITIGFHPKLMFPLVDFLALRMDQLQPLESLCDITISCSSEGG